MTFIDTLSRKFFDKDIRKKLGYSFITILVLAIIGLYIVHHVAIGFLTKSIWEVESDENDEEINLKIKSGGIPAHNKLMLIKIGNIVFWTTLVLAIGKSIKQMRK